MDKLRSATTSSSTTCAKVWTKLKEKWAEKLLGVLWAYRITKCVSTGETLLIGVQNGDDHPGQHQHADAQSGRSGPRPE